MSEVDRTRAIPTTYRGVRMRSRLEARWAAVFDQLGIAWDYEPVTLDRYIPDFMVKTFFCANPPIPGPVLVEVRPYARPAEFAEGRQKIARSGWTGPAIICGASLDVVDGPWGRESFVGYGHPAVAGRHANPRSDEWFRVGWCDGQWGAGGRDLTTEWREAGNRVRYTPGGR